MSQRSTIILFISVLITIVAFSGLFYLRQKKSEVYPVQPQNERVAIPAESENISPTSIRFKDGWKVYRNEKYGYEVRYPNRAILRIIEVSPKAGWVARVVSSFPPNHPYIEIATDEAFVSFCDECGPYGPGSESKKIEQTIEIDGKLFNVSGFSTNVPEITSETVFVGLPNFGIRYGFSSQYGSALTLNQIQEAKRFIDAILSTVRLY